MVVRDFARCKDLRYRVASDFDFFGLLKNGYTIESCNNSVVFLSDGGNSSESLSARLEVIRIFTLPIIGNYFLSFSSRRVY